MRVRTTCIVKAVCPFWTATLLKRCVRERRWSTFLARSFSRWRPWRGGDLLLDALAIVVMEGDLLARFESRAVEKDLRAQSFGMMKCWKGRGVVMVR